MQYDSGKGARISGKEHFTRTIQRVMKYISAAYEDRPHCVVFHECLVWFIKLHSTTRIYLCTVANSSCLIVTLGIGLPH